MSDKDRERVKLTPEEIEEFSDTDLPADATVEDAMGAGLRHGPLNYWTRPGECWHWSTVCGLRP